MLLKLLKLESGGGGGGKLVVSFKDPWFIDWFWWWIFEGNELYGGNFFV